MPNRQTPNRRTLNRRTPNRRTPNKRTPLGAEAKENPPPLQDNNSNDEKDREKKVNNEDQDDSNNSNNDNAVQGVEMGKDVPTTLQKRLDYKSELPPNQSQKSIGLEEFTAAAVAEGLNLYWISLCDGSQHPQLESGSVERATLSGVKIQGQGW